MIGTLKVNSHVGQTNWHFPNIFWTCITLTGMEHTFRYSLQHQLTGRDRRLGNEANYNCLTHLVRRGRFKCDPWWKHQCSLPLTSIFALNSSHSAWYCSSILVCCWLSASLAAMISSLVWQIPYSSNRYYSFRMTPIELGIYTVISKYLRQRGTICIL